MRFAATTLSLLVVLAVPTASWAQLMCRTPYMACGMLNGVPGGPCFCVTPSGPIQGITQIVGGAAISLPQFCCTPGGRFGPFNNTSVGPGQVCQVPTPAGPVFGQACF